MVESAKADSGRDSVPNTRTPGRTATLGTAVRPRGEFTVPVATSPPPLANAAKNAGPGAAFGDSVTAIVDFWA